MIFEWTSHPIREKPRKALLFWVVAGLVLGAVYAAFQELGWVLVAALFLVGSLADFLFPTRYRLTASGIEIRRVFGKVAKKWSDFRRIEVGRNGIFLSPFEKPRWLENYRGLFLPYPPEKDSFRNLVREKIEATVGASVGRALTKDDD
ncbi:MAG: hypothetical protein FJY66_03895, partial [Calditrichaeota bacterium]|nr:hypothetical protein [Calditrichota bacterium]